MVLVFGGQGVVDVEGIVLLGRGLHRVLEFVLGIRIILPEGEGGEGVESTVKTPNTSMAVRFKGKVHCFSMQTFIKCHFPSFMVVQSSTSVLA